MMARADTMETEKWRGVFNTRSGHTVTSGAFPSREKAMSYLLSEADHHEINVAVLMVRVAGATRFQPSEDVTEELANDMARAGADDGELRYREM